MEYQRHKNFLDLVNHCSFLHVEISTNRIKTSKVHVFVKKSSRKSRSLRKNAKTFILIATCIAFPGVMRPQGGILVIFMCCVRLCK